MALYSESNLHEPVDEWTVARRHSGLKGGTLGFTSIPRSVSLR